MRRASKKLRELRDNFEGGRKAAESMLTNFSHGLQIFLTYSDLKIGGGHCSWREAQVIEKTTLNNLVI